MKAKKKNRFLTFCFSVLPGAAEMYMGFMKMGLSLMVAFFGLIWIPQILMLSELSLLSIVVWFYGFFHANHLASLSDEEFEKMEDTYLLKLDALAGGKDFVQKYHKWLAVLLILAGIGLLWNTAADLICKQFPAFSEIMFMAGNYIPRVFIAVLIMVAGIRMIKGKKAELALDEQPEVAAQEDDLKESALREEEKGTE